MADLKEQLTGVLDRAIANGEIAGANLLILKDGEELVYTQSGYADVDGKRPYNRDTIFRMYSMTKPITAAAAMILMERGLLDIAQAVGDFLPAFREQFVWENGRKVPVRRNMLVKDLLSMTAGISYGGEDTAGQEVWRIFEEVDAKLYGPEALTTVEIAEKLGQCGLSFHPGESWMYGTSADILGAVIEKVSGQRFGEFLEKELFRPLGMKDTAFYVPEEKRDRLAVVYETTPEGLKECPTNHLGIMYTLEKSPAFESGGAGLVSTLDDYAKFARMLLNNGRHEDKQIMQPQTVAFFTSGKLTPWQQDTLWRNWTTLTGYSYGNLMRVSVEPGMAHFQTWKGEYGWDGWLGAYFANSPANGVTVLMSYQRTNAGTIEVTRRMRNVLAANLQ